jgi:hypothetical protein
MSVINYGLAAASGLSLVTWALHTFVGGPATAGPLLASSLPPVAKYTNYYCWHLVTIVLLALSTAFGYAALVPSGLDVAVFATVVVGAFSLWSVLLVLWKHRRPWQLPQWLLFLAIGAAALSGLR